MSPPTSTAKSATVTADATGATDTNAQRNHYDLAVIGGGPGGYVAAIRAAQLGKTVACIDDNPSFGGTCLRVGCIPSKALLESSHHYSFVLGGLAAHGVTVKEAKLDLARMMKRKDQVVKVLTGGVKGLFKKYGVTPIHGRASFVERGRLAVVSAAGESTITADSILIATGSEPSTLRGVEFNGKTIVTSTEALAFETVPEKLAVIGAGVIGLELGSVWQRLGSQVTVLEYLDRILPGVDGEVAKEAHKLLGKQGLDFRLGKKVTGVSVANSKNSGTQNAKSRGGKSQSAKSDGKAKAKKPEKKTPSSAVTVEIEGEEGLGADVVLVAVGRRPVTTGLGLEKVGVELDERGFVRADASFRTTTEGIYAIGDVIGGPMLAHKAEEDGIACVEKLYAGYGHVDWDLVPSVVYTHPEIAGVGKTQEDLEKTGTAFRAGKFFYRANARARAMDDIEGFAKVLVHAETDRILGVHILGAQAGELIAEAAAAMNFGASGEDLARTCHAHPTLSETLKEAALMASQGRMINS